MYINDINILVYLGVILLGTILGQSIDWYKKRLVEKKNIFSKDIKEYLKKIKINYKYIFITIILNILILYFNGITLKTLFYILLVPLLLTASSIDYKHKIIPNRLTLTIFELGLIYTFIEGIININVAVRMLLGMLAGGGIFLIIAGLAGLILGKEAMGLGDVKIMGALGLFFGLEQIAFVSIISFLYGAIVSIILLIYKIKKKKDYIPFGPFIVLASLTTMIIPFNIVTFVTLKIITLGIYNGSLI